MKYCPNCGKELSYSAMFCTSCGHKFEANEQQSAGYGQQNEYYAQQSASYTPEPGMTYSSEPYYADPYGNPYASSYEAPKKSKKKLFIILGAVLAAVVALVVVLVLVLGGGPDGVVDKLEDVANGDADAYMEILDPLKTQGKTEAELEEMKKDIEERIQKTKAKGIEWNAEIEVVSKEEITGEEFEEGKEMYLEDGFELEEAYEYTVMLNVEVTNNPNNLDYDDVSTEHTIRVVKVDGDWYVYGNIKKFLP